jgi:hypothetical protein
LGTWSGDDMQLVGFTTNKNNFHFVRDLSEEELSNHKNYTPVFTEARNRFKLFRILDANYKELIPAIQFYANLTGEVRKINPEFKMFFGEIKPEENTDPITANLSLKFVPNDVLAELGISVSIKKLK